MDFNVSSIQNKHSESKINSCMKSIKNIINDYKPLPQPEKNYDIFEYAGDITSNTSIPLPGMKPTEETEVYGTTSGLLVHAGKITTDGLFQGRNILYSDYSRQITGDDTVYDFGEVESDTEPTEGKNKKDSIVIPGHEAAIVGNKYHDQTVNLDPEGTLGSTYITIRSELETITVTKEECDAYEHKGSIDVVYTILLEKAHHIKIGGKQNSIGEWTLVFYEEGNLASRWVQVDSTPWARLIFDADQLGVPHNGKNDEIIIKDLNIDHQEDNGVTTITTTTVQPFEIVSNKRFENNKWKYNKIYLVEKRVKVEKWTLNSITSCYIRQIYR